EVVTRTAQSSSPLQGPAGIESGSQLTIAPLPPPPNGVRPMNFTEVVVEGTLKPDGTLELDQKPNLAPGRVRVVLQQGSTPALPPGDPFFDMLKGIWAARIAAGLIPRTVDEVEAERRRLRDTSAEEVAEAGRLQRESRAKPPTASPTKGESE